MSEPFIGEIRIWGCGFVPEGWLLCAGGLVPLSSYQTLFAVIGTTYGGDGRTTFGLPNLQGRVPMHAGNGPGLTPRRIGQYQGYESVALDVDTLPGHTHSLNAQQTNGTLKNPQGAYLAPNTAQVGPVQRPSPLYEPPQSLEDMSPSAVSQTGSSVAHENRQPFLALNFCIAFEGLFPSRG